MLNLLLMISVALFIIAFIYFIYLKSNGLRPMLVLSDSMEPEIKTYQLILGESVGAGDALAIGDIVTYKRPGSVATITHRIEHICRDGYILKGDNNETEDPYIVKPDWILYKVVKH